MKKLVSIGMIMCSVASMQAALPSMRQKATVFAKMFQQQTRSKESLIVPSVIIENARKTPVGIPTSAGLQKRRERILNQNELAAVLQGAERRGLTAYVIEVPAGQERAVLAAVQASGIPFVALTEKGDYLPTGDYVQADVQAGINAADIVGNASLAQSLQNARIRETESVMITPSRAEITEGDSYEKKTIREKFSLYVESLYRRYFRS